MKLFAAIVPAILLLSCLALPSTALESKLLTVAEETISLDLDPSFEMVRGEFNTSERGMVSQEFIINNTDAPGATFIAVLSVYDETLSKLSPGALSELFLVGGFSGVEARGDQEIGNWTAIDHQGYNVTVHTMSTNDSRIDMLGGSYDMAVWNLDGHSYAVMVSLLDRNNTTQIINTLAIS